MKTFFSINLIIAFCFTSILVNGQNKVKWTSWEKALKDHEENPKKFIVDIYTDWCTWCKKMDKATFQKDHIAKYLNQNFYAVKFDGETKREIDFDGNSYKFIKSGKRGYHELAVAITQGQLSYPSVVFLDEKLNVIQAIPGFQDAKTFEMIMTYFDGDHYMNTPWATYTRAFKSRDQKVHTVSH